MTRPRVHRREGHGRSAVREGEYWASPHRSLQRFHIRGRQTLGSHQERCRSKRLHPSYVAAADYCAKGWSARVLCDASSIPSGRLRELEVRCACSESVLVAKDI